MLTKKGKKEEGEAGRREGRKDASREGRGGWREEKTDEGRQEPTNQPILSFTTQK